MNNGIVKKEKILGFFIISLWVHDCVSFYYTIFKQTSHLAKLSIIKIRTFVETLKRLTHSRAETNPYETKSVIQKQLKKRKFL